MCIKEYSIFNSNLKQSMIDIFKRIKEIPKDEENAKKYIQNFLKTMLMQIKFFVLMRNSSIKLNTRQTGRVMLKEILL